MKGKEEGQFSWDKDGNEENEQRNETDSKENEQKVSSVSKIEGKREIERKGMYTIVKKCWQTKWVENSGKGGGRKVNSIGS